MWIFKAPASHPLYICKLQVASYLLAGVFFSANRDDHVCFSAIKLRRMRNNVVRLLLFEAFTVNSSAGSAINDVAGRLFARRAPAAAV